MTGNNHHPSCTCGWCRGGWRGGRAISSGGRFNRVVAVAPSLPATGTRSTWTCDDFCCPTTCPRCGATVYFVRHNGGSVWFDQLGPPWTKHVCFDDDFLATRLRNRLAEEEPKRRKALFGVITETVVITPGKSGRIVIKCSDGIMLDEVFDIVFDIKWDLAECVGSLVVIQYAEDGHILLHLV